MEATLKQLSEQTNISYIEICGFMKVSEHLHKVHKTGSIPPVSGKGKASTVYKLSDEVVEFLKLRDIGKQ